MKIIRLSSCTDPCDGMMLIADSAWHPDRRPYFVPDFEAVCELRVAVRISRLGKAISPKFAHRYYDSVTVVWLTTPLDPALDTPAMAAADDTVVTGANIACDSLPLRMHIDAPAPMDVTVAPDSAEIDLMLSKLSRRITFKTGDLIILPEPLARFTPCAGKSCHVTAPGHEQPIIEFNIK